MNEQTRTVAWTASTTTKLHQQRRDRARVHARRRVRLRPRGRKLSPVAATLALYSST